MEANIELISRFFKGMADVPDEEIEHFISQVEVVNYKKSEFFCKQGEPSHKLGFVLSGLCRVYYRDADDNMFIRNFCPQGHPIASYATLLTGQKAHVFIEALENSVIAEISYENMISHYKRHPSWEKVGRKVAENMYIIRERREFQLLTMDAQERYDTFLRDYPGISERITQANIASFIGVNPVSLSRLLKNKDK